MAKSDKRMKFTEALERNLPAVVPAAQVPVKLTPAPEKDELISDSEDDYRYTRKKLKELIEKAEQSLDRCITVADEAEHPRAFEVLAGMLQTTSEMTDKLMALQSKRKDLILGKRPDPNDAEDAGKPNGTTNVAVFVGTTNELQKKLAEANAAAGDTNTTIIDATQN